MADKTHIYDPVGELEKVANDIKQMQKDTEQDRKEDPHVQS